MHYGEAELTARPAQTRQLPGHGSRRLGFSGRATLLSAVALAFCWQAALATGQDEPVLDERAPGTVLEIVRFYERLTQDVPISDPIGVVKGLTCDGTIDYLTPGSFFVYLPEVERRNLSVVAQSLDGRYFAKIELRVLRASPGYHKVAYSTKYGRYLRSMPSSRLALLAQLSARENEPPVLVPACPGLPTTSSTTKVILNSGATDVRLVLKGGSGDSVAACESMEHREVISDIVCSVDPTLHGAQDTWLIRQYFDHYLPRIEVRLHLE